MGPLSGSEYTVWRFPLPFCMKYTRFPRLMGYIPLPFSESLSPMSHSLSLALENVIKEVAVLTNGIEVQRVHYNARVIQHLVNLQPCCLYRLIYHQCLNDYGETITGFQNAVTSPSQYICHYCVPVQLAG